MDTESYQLATDFIAIFKHVNVVTKDIDIRECTVKNLLWHPEMSQKDCFST